MCIINVFGNKKENKNGFLLWHYNYPVSFFIIFSNKFVFHVIIYAKRLIEINNAQYNTTGLFRC